MNGLGRALLVVGGLCLFWSLLGRFTGLSPKAEPAATQANFMWRISHGRLGSIVRLSSAAAVIAGLILLQSKS